ncbi:MAG: Na/Pi cotransporter family protein [Halioglobus sp.]|nr:Na/Pi cotransporter family protein [Halioglobus sp.]
MSEQLHILIAGLTAVILFVYGLENFSREIEKISGEQFRRSISRATRIPVIGLLIGAIVTAVIQSSSATSVITIGLVNAGVLSFKNSVGIIFGSNIGTTITAQLVAFKLTAFAPVFILLGFFLSLTRSRYAIFGKTVFFFGFVFFSLNLISSALEPLKDAPGVIAMLSQPMNPLYAVLLGCVFTALVQSSSVTTGLAVVLTQQGLLGLENAVPLIMGANIGTTATAMIAMFNMDAAAKKTALTHLLFNVGGVAIFLPLVLLYHNQLAAMRYDPAVALATIHLVFNLATSLVFMLLITPFTRLIDRLVGEGKMDFKRLELPVLEEETRFQDVQSLLRHESGELLGFLQENYNLVTLSMETNYRGIFDAAARRLEYFGFVKREYMAYFARVVSRLQGQQQSRRLITVINQYDYLFQIHDSINDLFETKRVLSDHYVELRSDVLLLIRDTSSRTLLLFEELTKHIEAGNQEAVTGMSREMQRHLNHTQEKLLQLLADPERRDAGSIANFVTYSQRLKDKLINYANISLEMQASEAAAAEDADSAPAAPTASGDSAISPG